MYDSFKELYIPKLWCFVKVGNKEKIQYGDKK